ncbi:PREDICTED: uncharacterized protein LOC109224119 [Nicotiana attenuata]|uniref:uncharacterized protein LOC109224119 n=1 Tax=Nicotiana attenuata TaxID=49451 RepID=UPI000905124C|nr:PREDICTED: uncharacterized protein LOC109224119 [Nicotiana attenuata]
MSNEPDQIIPMWVMLPNLPIQFWTTGNLDRIASCLGRPIFTDKLTAQEDRISCVRMVIEMDISQPLLDAIPLEMPNGQCLMQVVEYKWKPLFCQDCLQMGHVTCSCKKAPDDAGNLEQQQVNKGRKHQKKEWRAKSDPIPNKDVGNVQILVSKAEQPNSSNDAANLITTGQQYEDMPMEKANNTDRGKQLMQMPEIQDKIRASIEMERMLRHNKFSALRIDTEKTTSNVVRVTSPVNKNPP